MHTVTILGEQHTVHKCQQRRLYYEGSGKTITWKSSLESNGIIVLCLISFFVNPTLYVTLKHKTSHKGKFVQIEIYASSES